MNKLQPWSYSALSLYESCPKRFYHLRIAKDFVEKKGEQATYGDVIHKEIEKYMRGDSEKLPIDIQHLQKYLDKYAAIQGEKLYEQKLAVNSRLEPTGWFDDDVFCRAIVDYAVMGDKFGLIIDWKTGKMKSDMSQLKLMAVIMFSFRPELEAIRAEFFWTQTKKPTGLTVHRHEREEIWADFMQRAAMVITYSEPEAYVPNPSGLCKKWCPVATCPYHGI